MTAIELIGLTKEFKGFRANDDISFKVGKGEIFGYLGPNGAGKTTTIRQLLGLTTPSAGTAKILGADIHNENELLDVKDRIGYLPDTLGFDEELTGRKVLDHLSALRGDKRREELLEIFNPPLDKRIRDYSRGNRQMLGMIQALMHDPDLIIMDEPTVGLDPIKQEYFYRFLLQEKERGKTVFFSSHVLSEVQRVCDRAAIIRNGRLVVIEDITLLLNRGGKSVWVKLRNPVDSYSFATDEMTGINYNGNAIEFNYNGDFNRLIGYLSDYDVMDIQIKEPQLEDIFKHYYNDQNENVSRGD